MGKPAAKMNSGPGFPELKQNYPVFRFMGGNFISFFGNQMYLIAIPLIVLAITGSPISMGIVSALERLPILLQPFMGILPDRLNRKKILLICDLGRCFIVGGVGVLFLFNQLELWQLYSASLIIGLFSQIYDTSQFASVPNLVRQRDLQTVNSLNTGLHHTAVLVGPGLGGLIISFYNPGYALLMNGLSFFISFLAILSLDMKVAAPKSQKISTFFEDVKEGFQFVVNTRPIFFTNLAMLASIFGTTLFLTMMIFHLKDTIQLSANQIGWLLSVGGLGAIGGAIVTGPLRKRFSYRRILFVASIVGGLSIVLFGLVHTYAWLILFNAVGTIAASMMNPCIVTLRQALTPDHLLGRVQATSRFMTWTLMPLAAFLAGILSEQIGTGETIVLGGTISTLASFIYLHSSLRRKNEETR
ncbi:MAG TPA: MFS transporter [Bacillales bacterium]|nr:MFS transporter [Bacillales bacterium]